MLRRMLVIALGALIVSACSSSRQAVRADSRLMVHGSETVEARDSVVVEVHDTIMETTTITYVLRQAQEPDEPEDTVKVTTVTDRLRSRDRDAIARQKTKTEIRVDTVYVERRDSVMVQGSGFKVNGEKARASPVVQTLKWVFWIIIGLIGLVIVMKIRSL